MPIKLSQLLGIEGNSPFAFVQNDAVEGLWERLKFPDDIKIHANELNLECESDNLGSFYWISFLTFNYKYFYWSRKFPSS